MLQYELSVNSNSLAGKDIEDLISDVCMRSDIRVIIVIYRLMIHWKHIFLVQVMNLFLMRSI